MPDESKPRSRRALLAAAAGGAAALAAQAALPLTAAAATGDDLVLGTPNEADATTSIANSTDASDAFAVTATGAGRALIGTSTGAAGVYAVSMDGSGAADPANTSFTGVYGWSPSTPIDYPYVGVGVVGQSGDAGVYGDGYWGVVGFGYYGMWAEGHVGVQGNAVDAGGIGVMGLGDPTSQYGLRVDGKIRFTHRAGRVRILAGKSSVSVAVPGITTASRVLAVLNANRSGRYVRAAVPSTGKITIYLNNTLSTSSYVAWLVLD